MGQHRHEERVGVDQKRGPPRQGEVGAPGEEGDLTGEEKPQPQKLEMLSASGPERSVPDECPDQDEGKRS